MSSTLYCMLMGIVLFCPVSGQTSAFNAKPLTPSHAVEGDNFTLEWTYTLNGGAFVIARFFNDTGSEADEIGRATAPGSISVQSKYQGGFRGEATNTRAELTIIAVQRSDEGAYRLNLVASGSGSLEDTVEIFVQFPPRNIAASSNQIVIAPANLTLECKADGNPNPNTTWTRLSDNTVITMPLNITGGQDTGSYRCKAQNGLGTLTKDVFVDVQFLPIVALASKLYVGRGQTASLNCSVEGNPTPSITWSPCDLPKTGCDKEYLNIPNVQTARAYYTCTATNKVGKDSETTILIIGGKNVYLRMRISAECNKNDSVWVILQSKLRDVFANTSYNGTRLRAARCGSLIFDLILMFRTEVGEDDIIDVMKTAVSEGKFGDLRINVSSIIGIPPVIPTTATSSSAMSTPKSERNNIWIIVGAVLGAVALVVIIAVIVWCVRKKKCSNETKEVSDGNDAGQGKGGGAQGQNAGDESAYDSAYSNATVLPPSKKPANTVKEDAGQAIALPVYAQVDKSKKKPRSEKEAQRQPGELLYVQADHSNEGSLPTKASGNPSRPPPYQDTVYADLV